MSQPRPFTWALAHPGPVVRRWGRAYSRRMRRAARTVLGTGLASFALVSCNAIFGLEEGALDPSATTTTTSGSGGTGGTGGTGGAGGSGGSGGSECLPEEDCSTPDDDDCSGEANEGCPCTPGTTEPCYTGTPGTEGIGACVAGTHTCNDDGIGFGECMGERVDAPETCNTPDDDDCDDETNEEGEGCVCLPDTETPCWTGDDPRQAGVGECVAGLSTCNDQGTAYLACEGEVLPATEDCDDLGDEDCDGYACSEPIWANSFSPSGQPRFLGVDTDSNVFIYGTFTSSLTFGNTTLITAGSSDLFLAKLGPDGEPLWAKRYGDPVGQLAVGLTVSPDGAVYVATSLSGAVDFGGGAFSASAGKQGIALAKIDAAGAHVWSKKFEATSLVSAGLAVDDIGNVNLAGHFEGIVDFGTGSLTSAGATDIFVAELDPTGAGEWAKRFGDPAAQQVSAFTTDPAGNIALMGTHAGSWTFGGGATITASGSDLYIGRLSSAGAGSCERTIDSAALVTSMSTTSTGAIVAAGTFSVSTNLGGSVLTAAGSGDMWLAEFSTACWHQWSTRLGGSANDLLPSIAIDSNNRIVLGAATTGDIDLGGGLLINAGPGTGDVILARFSPAGIHEWSRIFGSAADEFAGRVALTGANEIVFATSASGEIDLGLGPLPSGLVVAKYAP